MQLTLFFTITCNPPLCYIKGNIIQSVQVYQAMSASIKGELTNASLHYICISLQNYTVVHRNTGCCRPQLPVFQDFARPLLGGLFLLSVWIRTDTKKNIISPDPDSCKKLSVQTCGTLARATEIKLSGHNQRNFCLHILHASFAMC